MRLCLPGCQTSPTKMFPNYINISKFLFSGPVHYQTKSRKKGFREKRLLNSDWSHSLTQKWNSEIQRWFELTLSDCTGAI